MKLQWKLATILGALAMPAMAPTAQPTNPGQGNGPKYTPAPPEAPGPGAGLP